MNSRLDTGKLARSLGLRPPASVGGYCFQCRTADFDQLIELNELASFHRLNLIKSV